MVDQVQAQLEAIYGIASPMQATRYVVSDEAAAISLGASGRAPEELLVLEEDGELDVALYLSPHLLERLSAFEGRPWAQLMEGELNAFCQLAEGVSHFLYLAYAAQEGRRVSLLELEAQAEVDKFACCLLPRWAEDPSQWGECLLRRLFYDVRYAEGLSDEERDRYVQANALSRGYCKRLLTHARARRLDRLLSELRFSYRLGAGAKLSHWARTH